MMKKLKFKSALDKSFIGKISKNLDFPKVLLFATVLACSGLSSTIVFCRPICVLMGGKLMLPPPTSLSSVEVDPRSAWRVIEGGLPFWSMLNGRIDLYNHSNPPSKDLELMVEGGGNGWASTNFENMIEASVFYHAEDLGVGRNKVAKMEIGNPTVEDDPEDTRLCRHYAGHEGKPGETDTIKIYTARVFIWQKTIDEHKAPGVLFTGARYCIPESLRAEVLERCT